MGKGKPHPGLLDFLTESGPLTGKIRPGLGSGHDVRRLSTADNHVVGIDPAPFAIKQAKSRPAIAHEEYLPGDLFALPPTFDGQFDRVFEDTCFCAIDPSLRKDYVATIVRLLKPGGRLLAIFFINPDHDEDGPPHRITTAELDEFFGRNFTVEREWVPARTHPGRERRELMRVLKRAQIGAGQRPTEDRQPFRRGLAIVFTSAA